MNDMPDQNPDPPVEYDPRDDPPSASVPPRTLSRATQRRYLRSLTDAYWGCVENEIPPFRHSLSECLPAVGIAIFLSAIADGEEWR